MRKKSGLDYSTFGAPMPGRTFSSTSYRYGMNGQEHDEEIANGVYTAEFWQYDSRLGRRWNIDPKPNASVSVYACFANNPIYFNDPAGDTVEITDALKNNPEAYKAFQQFAASKNGQKFLANYAYAGQTIEGHTYEKDGKYQKQGVDVTYTTGTLSPSAGGQTDAEIKDDRLKLTVVLNNDFDTWEKRIVELHPEFRLMPPQAKTARGRKETYRLYLHRRELVGILTVTHESMIHVQRYTRYWLYFHAVEDKETMQHHETEEADLLNGTPTLFNTDGFDILWEYNKSLNTDITEDQLKYLMRLGL